MSLDSHLFIDRYHTHTVDEENMFENYDNVASVSSFGQQVDDEVMDTQVEFDGKKRSIDDYLLDVMASPLTTKQYDESILTSLLEMDVEEAFELGEEDSARALKQKSTKNETIALELSAIQNTLPKDTTSDHYKIIMPFTNGSCSLKNGNIEVVNDEPFLGEDRALLEILDRDNEQTFVLVKYSIPNTADFFANPLSVVTIASEPTYIKLPFGNAFLPQISKFPKHGTVSLENGIFTYTSHQDFVGFDEFSYQLTEVRGQSSKPTTVLIRVADKLQENAVAPRIFHLFNETKNASYTIFEVEDLVDVKELVEKSIKREKREKLIAKRIQEKEQIQLESQESLAKTVFGRQNVEEHKVITNSIQTNSAEKNTEESPSFPHHSVSILHKNSSPTLQKIVLSANAFNQVQSLLQTSNKDILFQFKGNVPNNTILNFEIAHDSSFSKIYAINIEKHNNTIIGGGVSTCIKNVPQGQWFWRITQNLETLSNDTPSSQSNEQAPKENTPVSCNLIPCIVLETIDGDFVEQLFANEYVQLESNGKTEVRYTTEGGMLEIQDSQSQNSLSLPANSPYFIFDGKQPIKKISFEPNNLPREIIFVKL
jgi:hypothetical protein